MGSFSLSHWIILGLMVWAVVAVFRRSGSGGSRRERSGAVREEQAANAPTVAPAGKPVHHWEPHKDHSFDFEVVGESNYQAALAKLAGTHGDESPHLEVQALLVPETDNPHDKNAVRVVLSGMTVGYLARDDAGSFRRRLSGRKLTGQVTSCDAVIVGGFVGKDGKRASYGVRLDMKPFI
jgi:hypothetical protein